MKYSPALKSRERSLLILAAGLTILLLVLQTGHRAPISSAETRFVEYSTGGMQIVPASCPSETHNSGQCSHPVPCSYSFTDMTNSCICPAGYMQQGEYCYPPGSPGNPNPPPPGTPPPPNQPPPPPPPQCTPQYFCSGNNLYYKNAQCNDSFVEACAYGCAGNSCNPAPQCTPQYFCSGSDLYHKSAQCADSFVEHCTWGCAGSACKAPPPPTITLQASPSLVRQGETSTVTWTSQNAASCTLSEDNPQINNSSTQLSGTMTTSPLNMVTTYTLTCQGHPGSTPASVTKSVTINIIPVFEEI